MVRIAAIDQGTTSTRALVVGDDGQARIVQAIAHEQQHPHDGWVEQCAATLLANVLCCIRAAQTSSAEPLTAIGIDNQGESCLAWDALTGEALSPVIVWQDSRTSAMLRQMHTAGAAAVTLARAGLPLDPYFSASKLAWLLQHNPRVQAAHAAGRLRLGTTDAFFLDRLTGHFATDTTTASRTSLMNIETGEWDPVLCDLFQVPMDCLPEIRATVGDFGAIDGVPVTASVVDQQAALYGQGCRARGDAKMTFGTGAFALTLTGPDIVRVPQQGLLPTVAWRIGDTITYALDGGVYDAGAAVQWAGRLGLYESLASLDAFAPPDSNDAGAPDAGVQASAIARHLVFVPALSGLACPHWDRDAGALWIGMQAGTSKADLCRALLEGIAFCAADVITAMREHVGVQAQLRIDGGLSENRYFAQFLAEVLDMTVVTSAFPERTALGCAALAAQGAGLKAWPASGVDTGADRCYTPRLPPEIRHAWRARFADAVQRARQWRQS